MLIEVLVRFKPGISDPMSEFCLQQVHDAGFTEITELQKGKYIQIEMGEMPRVIARKLVRLMCLSLLANGVVENFEILPKRGNRRSK